MTEDLNKTLIHRLCYAVAIVFGVTIILTWIILLLIPDDYFFFRDYISYLGGIYTKHSGERNLIGQISFSVGLVTVAILLVMIAIQYLKVHEKKDISKAIILIIAAIGAIMTAVPHDVGTYSYLHFMGAFGFVVALDIFLLEAYFFATKKDNSTGAIIEKITTIILLIITLVYSSAYIYLSFINSAGSFLGFITMPYMPLIQKIMVIFILLGFGLIDKQDLETNRKTQENLNSE